MKRFALILTLTAMILASGAALAAEKKDMVPCSVCGYLVPKGEALTTVYEGTTYYFCEAGCKAYFLMNPAEMSAGNDMDPVCGMTVKKAGSIEIVQDGRQIHFCSSSCKDRYLADPAAYAINYDVVSNEVKPEKEMKYRTTFKGRPMFFVSEANKSAFEKNPDAYLYAECPVTGKVFLRKDAGATVVYEGKTRYFCCKGCLEKFNKDPKKYMGPASAATKGCGEKDGKMKTGATKEAGCPMAEAGACPKAKTCKEGKK